MQRKLLDIVHHQLESKKKLGSKGQGPGQAEGFCCLRRRVAEFCSLCPDGEDEEAGETVERKPPDMEVRRLCGIRYQGAPAHDLDH